MSTVKTSVQLTGRSRKVLDAIRDDTGIPQTEAIARIFEWFFGLDRKFRLAVLLKDVEAKQEFSRLALSQMAGLDKVGINKPPGEVKVEDAAAAMHTLVDQMLAVAQDRGKGLASEAAKLQAALKGQGGKGK